MRLALIILALGAGGLAAAPASAATRPLDLGFFDPVLATSAPANDWATSVGAGTLRFMIGWGATARNRPSDPTNPADPAYSWTSTDEAVRTAAARGHRILLNPTGTAPWAEGPGRPADVDGGVWDPDPVAYGQFAAAAARRYSGAFPDPLRPGRALPAVRHWQAWNEPNIYTNLMPQWRRVNGRQRPYAPALYRRMLNAFYAGVKGVDRRNVVVTAGMAPFGDPEAGGRRLRPVRFWRDMLSERVRFDVISHHPYGVGAPRRAALNRDDATIPDVAKITRVVRSAVTRGRALPKRLKPLWITEVSWDSSPPDPNGVPAATHARWVSEAFFLLWRQGASVITWFRAVDDAPDPDYGATNQSGVFLLDGTPKLSARAYRFPFATERVNGRTVRVWGKAPTRGTVTIERRSAGRWKRVTSVSAGRNRVFYKRATLRGRGTLRARIGADASVPFSQR